MTIFTTYSAADSAIGWALVIIGALGAVAFAASFLDGPRDRLAAWLYRRRVRAFGPGTGRHAGTSGHPPEVPATLVASLPATTDRTGGTIPGVVLHGDPPWSPVPVPQQPVFREPVEAAEMIRRALRDGDFTDPGEWLPRHRLHPLAREHFSKQHTPRHAPTQPREHA